MATSTRHLWTSRRAQFLVLALIAAVVVISAAQLESAVLLISQSYADWLTRWTGQNAWAVFGLPALAFGGGLIASVSPCVLALLPVQLSYLGAQKQQRPNPGKVIQFSFGVVTAYSILGLFTSLAGALIIDHRGGLFVTAGVIVIAMALQLKGWGPRFPWHRLNVGGIAAPRWIHRVVAGPFLIGFTFALVTSPCASPVLAAVLSAAAATSTPPLAVLSMVLYSIGYSMVILLAGLGVELGGLRRALLKRGEQITGISAMVLLTFGGIYLWTGVQDLVLQGHT